MEKTLELTPKQEFILYLEATKESCDYGFVGVVVNLPNQTEPELIINAVSSLDQKIEYYKNAYNDDLKLIVNEGIFVVGYGWFATMTDSQYLFEDVTEDEI